MTAENKLRRDLAAFVEKMKQAGIDITTIKKPTDVGASISFAKEKDNMKICTTTL